MARVIAYLRVSTERQAKDGLGLEVQLDAVQKVAGADVVVYRDEGLSGDRADRPGLLAALEALSEGDVLVVARLDRLARSVYLSAWIQKEVKKRGARILSCAGEGSEGDDPTSQLMVNIICAFAEFEKAQIVAKLAAGRAKARKLGRKMGGDVPYGYKLAADGKHLAEEPQEQHILSIIRALRAEGQTLRQIGAEMQRRGVIQRRGGTGWNPKTVAQLIAGKTDLGAVQSRAA